MASFQVYDCNKDSASHADPLSLADCPSHVLAILPHATTNYNCAPYIPPVAAIADAKLIVEAHPGRARGYSQRGMALCYEDEYLEAASSLIAALDLDPTDKQSAALLIAALDGLRRHRAYRHAPLRHQSSPVRATALGRSMRNDMENARTSRFAATPPMTTTICSAPPQPKACTTDPK